MAYSALLKSRRRELHRAVAEALVNGGTPVQPAVLAYHWEAAGEVEAAVAAWQQAAEQAQRRAAVLEAEAHYRRAVSVLAALPDESARSQLELPLQIALFTLLMVTRGPQDAAVEEAASRAGALAERLGDATNAVLVLIAPWAAAGTRGEHRASMAIARQMERLAERDGAAIPRVIAHLCMGIPLVLVGELDAGRTHLERVLALYNDADFRWLPMSPQGVVLGFLAYEALLAGRADSAHQRQQEAVAAAAQRGVLSDVANAQIVALILAAMQRETAGCAEPARRLLKLCTDHDLPGWLAPAQVFTGWILACEEDPSEGLALLRDGLHREQGELDQRSILAVHLSLLAEVYARGGALPEALATLDEAFAAIGDEEIWRPDLLRLRGDLLIVECEMRNAESSTNPQSATHNPQLEEAERCYREAIERARGMGAKAFELRAATRLGRLLQSQDRGAEAHELLAPLYASFTEGFDTRDLREAKALLEEVQHARPPGPSKPTGAVSDESMAR